MLSDVTNETCVGLKREAEDRSRWQKSSSYTCHTRQKTEEEEMIITKLQVGL